MELSPERQEEILRLLVQRESVRKDQLADCRRIARQRQMPGRQITPLDILLEMGQVSAEDVQELDRQCGAPPPPSKPAINPLMIGVAAVSLPVLLLLAWLAFRTRPQVDQGQPTNLKVSDFDPSVVKQIEEAKNPKATAEELEREKAAKEFEAMQAKKHSTVARTPQLGPGQSAYIGDKAKVSNKNLKDYFVPFSFAYPSTWQIETNEGKESSETYVTVRRHAEAPDGGHDIEKFEVGFLAVLGADRMRLKQTMPKASRKLSQEFLKQFPNFKITGDGEMKIGSYTGIGFEGEGKLDLKPSPIKYWVRFVLIPPGTGSQQYGLTVYTMATEEVPEIKGVKDLGSKGEVPAILASFAIGG